ncbi:MAG: ArsC family reductase [Proteobacteria bacterium]|jgi:arsenate reductase|nr:ArsC family reductase [Pseudomonadota bacterium]
MLTVYGIKNCDTVKKARRWLEDHDIDFAFHDVRTDGLDKDMIDAWAEGLGWETLVNKRSTTWRGLDDSTRLTLDAGNVADLLIANPTLIKRPVIDDSGKLLIGFQDQQYRAAFL